jgi:hypothetical protein
MEKNLLLDREYHAVQHFGAARFSRLRHGQA